MQGLKHVAIGGQERDPEPAPVLEGQGRRHAHVRAFSVIREIPVESDAIAQAVTPLLQDADENVRNLAKEVLAFQGKS